MLVDPNKIDAAIKLLTTTQRDPNANVNYEMGRAIRLLTECVNQGHGDRSEPTTYAEMLASARSWAQERIAEDADVDREDIIDRAVRNVLVRTTRTQALIEVFMSKPDLINVNTEDEWWEPTPGNVMAYALRLALIKDMQDLIDKEDSDHAEE